MPFNVELQKDSSTSLHWSSFQISSGRLSRRPRVLLDFNCLIAFSISSMVKLSVEIFSSTWKMGWGSNSSDSSVVTLFNNFWKWSFQVWNVPRNETRGWLLLAWKLFNDFPSIFGEICRFCLVGLIQDIVYSGFFLLSVWSLGFVVYLIYRQRSP